MVITQLKEPIWIAAPHQLKAMIDDLARYSRLAVDTESNSLYAYQEQVCLIQFSTGETDYLVDPLARMDFSPLGDIFANPNIEKIFHAAEYDLLCMKRDFNFQFSNLFDTMQAARILGRQNVGLASILNEEFGLKINKVFQRANWGKRPIPQNMRDYARYDTHYLIPLRHRLHADLVARQRLPLAMEDFQRTCHLTSAPVQENSNGSCWKIMGHRDLSTAQLAILQALCEFREQQAKSANLPPFKVLSDRDLLHIALNHPTTQNELLSIEAVSPRLANRYGEGILEAVRRGQNERPPARPPSNPRPSDAYLARLEAMRNWRKDTGEEYGVPSDVILPRDVMDQIVQANPRSLPELLDEMTDIPWRAQQFGQRILKVLKSLEG